MVFFDVVCQVVGPRKRSLARLALVCFYVEMSAEIVTCECAASVEFAGTNGTRIVLGWLLALTLA